MSTLSVLYKGRTHCRSNSPFLNGHSVAENLTLRDTLSLKLFGVYFQSTIRSPEMANPKYQDRIRVTVNSPESRMLIELTTALGTSVMGLMSQIIREKYSRTFNPTSPVEAMENTYGKTKANS